MGHRTPLYVVNRFRQLMRDRRRPGEPWWAGGAIDLADRWVRREDVVVEFGSGRSTAWLAARAGRVVSVEHHAEWHAKVSEQLRNLSNAEVRLCEDTVESYLAASDDVEGVTLVVNDGLHRDEVARWAIDRIAPGGAMVLDDSHRYLERIERFTNPSVPPAPHETPMWPELREQLSSWRRLTYSDGVKDTTLLVKPVS